MKKRLISAIVMLAVFVPLIILGGFWFEIAITVVAILAYKELISIYEKNIKIPIILKVLSYLSVGLLVICAESLLPCLALIILFNFIPIIFINKNEYNYSNAVSLFGITIFIGIIFYVLSSVRMATLEEFIYLILITILTDTFAYIGGKLLGRHKLIPQVSPNKTVEGSIIGSMVGTLVPCFVYLFFVNPDINIAFLIFMTFVISIFGQLGDLLFSSIKRYYKIKDFSNIIPGHGGILDRFDSVLIAAVAYTVIKLLFL